MVFLSSLTANIRQLSLKHFSTSGAIFTTASAGKQSNLGRLPKGFGAINAYALFSKEQFRSGDKIGTHGKRISALWKGMSETDKKKYQSQAEKITSKRRSDFENLPPAEQIDLKAQSINRLAKSKSISYHKKINELGKPKQPPNAYALFVKHVNKDVKSSNEAKKGVEKAAKVWKAMGTSEKAKYQAEYTKLRAKYDADMKVWEAEMKERGEEIPVRPVKRSRKRVVKASKSASKVARAKAKRAKSAAPKKNRESQAKRGRPAKAKRGRPAKKASAKK